MISHTRVNFFQILIFICYIIKLEFDKIYNLISKIVNNLNLFNFNFYDF
jgi:hypothetical protein